MTFIEDIQDFFNTIGQDVRDSWDESLPWLSGMVALIVFIVLLIINWKIAIGFVVSIVVVIFFVVVTMIFWLWYQAIKGAIDSYNKRVKESE